jgi:hypothetical protein
MLLRRFLCPAVFRIRIPGLKKVSHVVNRYVRCGIGARRCPCLSGLSLACARRSRQKDYVGPLIAWVCALLHRAERSQQT